MANNFNEAETNGNSSRERIRQAYSSLLAALCRFAAAKTGNNEDARDIVSNVFLEVLKNPEPIKKYKSLPAYLYKIVANDCKDYLKHQKIKRKHEEDMQSQIDFFQQHDNETPLFLMISKEREIEILDAIDELPEVCGKVLHGRLEGLKYKEIAEKLNISVHTVRTHISDGTKKLRKYFEDNEN